jgi:hypothetical protein
MRFGSQWPGDAIAAPTCGAYDPQDAFFESLGGRSWNRVAWITSIASIVA